MEHKSAAVKFTCLSLEPDACKEEFDQSCSAALHLHHTHQKAVVGRETATSNVARVAFELVQQFTRGRVPDDDRFVAGTN